MAQHRIKVDDFKDYVAKVILASSTTSADKSNPSKRLTLLINTATNKVSYNISQGGFTKCTAYDLPKAIEVYNCL